MSSNLTVVTGHSDGASAASTIAELWQRGASAGKYAQSLREILRKMSKDDSKVKVDSLKEVLKLGELIVGNSRGDGMELALVPEVIVKKIAPSSPLRDCSDGSGGNKVPSERRGNPDHPLLHHVSKNIAKVSDNVDSIVRRNTLPHHRASSSECESGLSEDDLVFGRERIDGQRRNSPSERHSPGTKQRSQRQQAIQRQRATGGQGEGMGGLGQSFDSYSSWSTMSALAENSTTVKNMSKVRDRSQVPNNYSSNTSANKSALYGEYSSTTDGEKEEGGAPSVAVRGTQKIRVPGVNPSATVRSKGPQKVFGHRI